MAEVSELILEIGGERGRRVYDEELKSFAHEDTVLVDVLKCEVQFQFEEVAISGTFGTKPWSEFLP